MRQRVAELPDTGAVSEVTVQLPAAAGAEGSVWYTPRMSPTRSTLPPTPRPVMYLVSAVSLLCAGCAGAPTSSADGQAPAASSCQPLAKQCHAVSDRDPAAAACHELGHRGDEAACTREAARCRSVCSGAERHDAGP